MTPWGGPKTLVEEEQLMPGHHARPRPSNADLSAKMDAWVASQRSMGFMK